MKRRILLHFISFISCILLFLVCPLLVGGQVSIKKVADWGTGNYQDVFVQGNYAYCAASYAGLDIIDISSPSNPVRTGNYFFSTHGSVSCVHVRDNYAYIGSGGEMAVIDISNPAAPVKTGECSPSYDYGLSGIYVLGNYAYTTSGEGLSVIDISNPSVPRVTGNAKAYYSNNVFVANGYAYVTDDRYGLMIFDISNPGSPSLTAYNDDPTYAFGVWVNGDYAYVADHDRGVKIFDVTDPNAPVLVGTYDTSGSARDVLVSENHVFAADYYKGLKIIDISQPGSPVLTGSFYHSGASWGLDKKEDIIYSADYDQGLKLIDVSNPASPALLGSFNQSGFVQDIIKEGDYVYLISRTSGLRIIDVTDPSQPKQLGYFDTQQSVMAAAVEGKYAYIAENNKGLSVIDIRNPASPRLYGHCSFGSFARDMFKKGNYIYLADSTNGLRIIDVSSASLPGQVGAFESSYASGIVVRRDRAYLADGGDGLVVLDLSNPIKPVKMGQYKAPGNKVTIQGDLAFMVHEDFGLYIIDITSPSSPILVSSYPIQGAMDVEVNGKYIFLTVAFNGIHIIDISDPAYPSLAAHHPMDYYSEGLCQEGNHVYAAVGQNGMRILEVLGLDPVPPYILLNRNQLNFGIQRFGSAKDSREVFIDNSGGGDLKWTASTNQSWLSCSPQSGDGTARISVSVDATGLEPGSYNGKVQISDPYASNSPKELPVTLYVYDSGQTSGPMGYFDTPVEGSAVYGSVPVTGWAIDDIGVDNVKIYRREGHNLIYIGDAAFVEGARTDVQYLYPDYPGNYSAGWGYMLLTNFLPNGGNGTFTLTAIATDREGNQSNLGSKTINCDNANAILPFGALDTPLQGGIVSADPYINWGWVLTPQPNHIPMDGSTLAVWVDGVYLGRPNYNIYRSDIATLFPGYANSDGAVGYFSLDTTVLENGVHTIQWTATDNAGNTDGIGSRYFTVRHDQAGQSNVNNSKNHKNQKNQKNRYKPIRHPSIKNITSDTLESITVQTGFIPDRYEGDNRSRQISASQSDIFQVKSRELERVKITLRRGRPVLAGYSFNGGQLRPLPTGTTLDVRSGTLLWQPGPGFRGSHTFLFVYKYQDGQYRKKTVEVKIGPKFDGPQLLQRRHEPGHAPVDGIGQ